MKSTERINENTRHIDSLPTSEMIKLIQKANMEAAEAVGKACNEIAEAVDRISERMKRGGRLVYVGCGTSGRLGVIDAAECPPTFGVSAETVVGIIAGGDGALRRAAEGAEDNPDLGIAAIAEQEIGENDSVVGISASGGAAFVVAALTEARKRGALTVSVSSNGNSEIGAVADLPIVAETGSEVIAGSTRMKAGTSQKMILNMLSTGVMVRLGYVYGNMMINLRPTNRKLKARMVSIVSEITGKDTAASERLLGLAGWNIPTAIRMEGAKE